MRNFQKGPPLTRNLRARLLGKKLLESWCSYVYCIQYVCMCVYVIYMHVCTYKLRPN